MSPAPSSGAAVKTEWAAMPLVREVLIEELALRLMRHIQAVNREAGLANQAPSLDDRAREIVAKWRALNTSVLAFVQSAETLPKWQGEPPARSARAIALDMAVAIERRRRELDALGAQRIAEEKRELALQSRVEEAFAALDEQRLADASWMNSAMGRLRAAKTALSARAVELKAQQSAIAARKGHYTAAANAFNKRIDQLEATPPTVQSQPALDLKREELIALAETLRDAKVQHGRAVTSYNADVTALSEAQARVAAQVKDRTAVRRRLEGTVEQAQRAVSEASVRVGRARDEEQVALGTLRADFGATPSEVHRSLERYLASARGSESFSADDARQLAALAPGLTSWHQAFRWERHQAMTVAMSKQAATFETDRRRLRQQTNELVRTIVARLPSTERAGAAELSPAEALRRARLRLSGLELAAWGTALGADAANALPDFSAAARAWQDASGQLSKATPLRAAWRAPAVLLATAPPYERASALAARAAGAWFDALTSQGALQGVHERLERAALADAPARLREMFVTAMSARLAAGTPRPAFVVVRGLPVPMNSDADRPSR